MKWEWTRIPPDKIKTSSLWWWWCPEWVESEADAATLASENYQMCLFAPTRLKQYTGFF